jgi:hypothetical protein
VAMHLFEDLIAVGRSPKLIDAAINRKERVLNAQNKRRGISARRGDGTFGEIIPGETAVDDAGYLVARGPIATVEIGVEVKILAKAMIKQIDRGSTIFGIRWFSSSAAGENRSALPWLESIAPLTPWDMRATGPFRRPANRASCTPFRKRRKRRAACFTKRHPSSTSFLCFDLRQPTRRRIPSNGSTITRRDWITQRPCRGSAPAINSGSDCRAPVALAPLIVFNPCCPIHGHPSAAQEDKLKHVPPCSEGTWDMLQLVQGLPQAAN